MNCQRTVATRSRRIEITFHGDGHYVQAAKEMAALTEGGHAVERITGNGATMLRYRRKQPRKPETYPYQGKQMTLAEIAEATGVKLKLLYARVVRYSWSISRAVSEPIETDMQRRRRIAGMAAAMERQFKNETSSRKGK